MERYLGLDVGDRTVGVAVSDMLGITAQGLSTIIRKTNKETFEIIKGYMDEYDVSKIVVGLPINMNGTIGPQGEKVQKFSEKLKDALDVEIIFQDERMTSISAERVLIEGGVRRENRKDYIDKIAAVFILQAFLDSLI